MSNEALRPLDQTLINVLVDNHRKFRSFLAKRVGSESVAEDLLQASLRKAIETPADAQEKERIVAWFFTILRNTLTDHYRSQATEGRKHEGFLHELTASGSATQAAADEVEAAICECFEALLPTLKASYADALRRVDLNGESVSAVAKDEGVSENNLSVRLHRARNALRISLERTCGTCTEHGCLNCTCS